MTISRCEIVNSYWSTSDMNETTSLTSLLTHDLEVRSRGATGRALLDALELYCVDLLGQPGPLEFALALRSEALPLRDRLEELLEWTAAEPRFQLVALVALAPELDRIARRLGRGSPSDDTVSEVLAQATEALWWTHEFVDGERRDFVMRHVRTRTRGEQRRMARHNVRTVPLPANFDFAKVEPAQLVSLDLDGAVRRGIITDVERRLIEATRGGKCTLREFAVEHAEHHWALYKRRARAERRLQTVFGVEVVR